MNRTHLEVALYALTEYRSHLERVADGMSEPISDDAIEDASRLLAAALEEPAPRSMPSRKIRAK